MSVLQINLPLTTLGLSSERGCNVDIRVSSIAFNKPLSIFSICQEYIIGPAQYGTFTSEFGCVAMSSFESMAATLPPENFGLHGNAPTDQCPGGFFRQCTGTNVMSQRNYAIDSLVTPYFGASVSGVNESGGEHIELMLRVCLSHGADKMD